MAKIIKRSEKEVGKKITTGEACGIVAAQSLGEPGTQMSINYDEKVIIRQNDEIEIVKIGEFVDSNMDEYGYFNENGQDICELPVNVNIYVPSLTHEEKIMWNKVAMLSRHKCKKKLLKITTRSGREITATPFHSFVIRKDNKIVPIASSELKKGDRIPVLKNISQTAVETIDIKPILENEIKFLTAKGGLLYAYPRENSKPLPQNIELNESFGWLTGIYLSEGNTTRNYTSISNIDERILTKIRNFAKKYQFTYNEYDNFRGFSKGHDIRINSTLLAQLLKVSCGSNSHSKKVPEFAYSASDWFVSSLLRAYFDGDGNINIKRKVIRVSSVSKDLIDGIAFLLNRFDIFSSKSLSKKSNSKSNGKIQNNYTLRIPQHYAKRFLDVIGSDILEKRLALEEICKYTFQQQHKQQYNLIDIIPGIGDVLYKTAEVIGFPKRLVNNFTKRQKIGRSTLIKYIDDFERMSNEKGVDITKNLSILQRAADSDVVWDEIKNIDYPKSEYNKVYDFTVPGSETFTTFEGIITHNTMRTFHYAGVAEEVPTGLPRMIEIVDIRKEPKVPMIDIYLDKKYSKDEKKVKAFAEKFEEVVLENIAVFVEDFSKRNILIKLDIKRIDDLKLDIKEVKKIIKESCKDHTVKTQGEKILIKVKKMLLKDIRKQTRKLAGLSLRGIKGIIRAVVLKDEKGEFFIRAGGSNLLGVIEIPDVDVSRCYTNNIIQMYEIFGIEATRNVIVKEINQVLEAQDLSVDLRHIKLLADAMTATGTVMSIGRHGLSGQKQSVLARAAFEETIKHLINASVYGEEDELKGVTENILIGQPIPIGSGVIKLKMRGIKK